MFVEDGFVKDFDFGFGDRGNVTLPTLNLRHRGEMQKERLSTIFIANADLHSSQGLF